jgi:hypothetical protein
MGAVGLSFAGVLEPEEATIRRNCLTGNPQNDIVSTLNQHVAMAQPERSLSTATGWFICGFILLLFVTAATLSALRKDVTRGYDFDEAAHASYIAHIQHSGKLWPALEDIRMLDTSSFQFTAEPNYLNHPSPYYALLAMLGPRLEGHPQAIMVYRLFNITIAAIGLAALLAIGLVARFSRLTLYAYVVPLACIPVLVSLAGSVNNDNAAFAGGAIATLGIWQLIATGKHTWLWAALGGLIIASWAKLTGLLLTGGMLGGVLVWLLWRGRLSPSWLVPVAMATLLAAAPYIYFIAQYGNPAPNTVGQITYLQTNANAAGWDSAARLSPLSYAVFFVLTFIAEWLPALAPRNAFNYAALLIPLGAVLCAFGGFALSVRRIACGEEGALDIVVAAGALAFAATFVVHGFFSYQRHVAFGWLMDAYPRYYLPLAAIIPLAGLSLLAATERPRTRTLLAGFLIAGPIMFRLVGAPLG